MDFGGSWEGYGRPQSIFWIVFFNFFFECVSASILGGSEPCKMHGASTGARKSMFSKKIRNKPRFWLRFRKPKRRKIKNNGVKKHVFVWLRFFRFFFCNFYEFWLDCGRPWALQKLKKNQFFKACSFEGGFWEGSGRVLGQFWKDFGRFLEGFWEEFSKLFGWIWKGKRWLGRPWACQ